MFELLKPVSEEILNFSVTLSEYALGQKIIKNGSNEFPDLDGVQIALLTVEDNRGNNELVPTDFTNFRKQFYSLFPGNWKVVIADLGTIKQGETLQDTYFLVKSTTEILLKNNIIPLVIGGTQDLTYPLYRSYDNLDQMVNLVAIDSVFDFQRADGTLASGYLNRIISEEPNNLLNFANLGYQSYYNAQEEVDLIEKLYFESYRLGEVSSDISIAEPVLRNADLVSVDLKAVEGQYSGITNPELPNGFSGKEICKLVHYAGISDKVSSFGVFNFENSNKSSVLVSQMVWYFIEGFAHRAFEYPFESKKDYLRYTVPIENDEDMVFYKSPKSGRWWIEVSNYSKAHNKYKKHTLLPCSESDYFQACEQQIPERWWKAIRKELIL